MKKVMMLGGNYFQVTATKAAKELGYYVISVDYLPENPAHQYADEYHNVSTTDREAVLKLARKLKIDGIVSYASDVSAPTAAYVAEQMGLPTNPLRAVEILTQKNLMREFMEKHGFSTPKGACFEVYEEGYQFFCTIKKPAMVKPVDASGSKGVSKIFEDSDFADAWNEAKKYSRCGKIIIEEFIQKVGYQIDGDIFQLDGKIVFDGLMDQHVETHCNGLVPIGLSYPSILPQAVKNQALKEVERLLNILGMKSGAYNVEFIIDPCGTIYILEIGPRNGGNLITDALNYATGVDLARATVRLAVGDSCNLFEITKYNYISSFILHSLENGILENVYISDKIKDDIIRLDLWNKPGDQVFEFVNASFGIGAALIRFQTAEEMCYRMDHMEEFIQVKLVSSTAH